MLTTLRLVDFKNFRDETLHMGPLTVIVGANASGKSNLRDAFRFLHGIGRGYTLGEIIGGKYGAGGVVVKFGGGRRMNVLGRTGVTSDCSNRLVPQYPGESHTPARQRTRQTD